MISEKATIIIPWLTRIIGTLIVVILIARYIYTDNQLSKIRQVILKEVINLQEDDVKDLIDDIKFKNLTISKINIKEMLVCLKNLEEYKPNHPSILRSIELVTSKNDLQITLYLADEFGEKTGFIRALKFVDTKNERKKYLETYSSKEFEEWFFAVLDKY